MRLLFAVILFFSFQSMDAQDATVFAPPGATWYFSHYTSFPPPALFKFVAEGDTILNGINATIVQFYNAETGVLEPVDSLNKYVYTLGNKVFYWVQGDFFLLYDFDALPGDTITSRVEDFPVFIGCGSDFSNGTVDFQYIIDSVGTITVDGQMLRVQFVSAIYTGDHSWNFSGALIERIGLTSYSDFWWGRGSACILGGFPGILRCYEDPDIYFKNPMDNLFTHECDEISSIATNMDKIKPIFPNPTFDFIHLPGLAESIFLYNAAGQLIFSSNNMQTIDLRNLLSNIYFIQYRIEDIWYAEKLLKTE